MFLEHIDGRRIMLMPGHTNHTHGCGPPVIKGETHYTRECEINTDIAIKLYDILRGSVPLTMHPPSDEPAPDDEMLNEAHAHVIFGHGTFARKGRLTELAQRVKPLDLTIEIHANWFDDPEVRGFECWVDKRDTSSQTLAQCLCDAIETPRADRRVRPVLPLHGAGVHYIYEEGNPNRALFEYLACRPLVLVECGFLSNRDDSKLLTMPLFQDTLAIKLAIGIDAYLGKLKDGTGAGGSSQ